jgi:hypothetical protein
MSLINFKSNFNEDYLKMADELLRVITVAVVVHILKFYSDGETGILFNDSWLEATCFSLLGFIAYHLITKKLIQIT